LYITKIVDVGVHCPYYMRHLAKYIPYTMLIFGSDVNNKSSFLILAVSDSTYATHRHSLPSVLPTVKTETSYVQEPYDC